MYELYWCDLGSEPNVEETVDFDDLAIAKAFAQIRILYSTFISSAAIWETKDGHRTKIARVFWHERNVVLIEDKTHELWNVDVLLKFLRAARESGDVVSKRGRS